MNNAPMPDWMKLIFDTLRGHIPKDFVGSVEVNVFKVGISNVVVKQSYKQEG